MMARWIIKHIHRPIVVHMKKQMRFGITAML